MAYSLRFQAACVVLQITYSSQSSTGDINSVSFVADSAVKQSYLSSS